MRQLISRFDRLSQSFPEVIIKSADELGKIEHEIVDTFDNDLKCIKRVLKDKKISININFKQFENPIYLYKKALYLQSEIPHSFENIMKFYLANLFICKQVLESIIRYMRELRRYIEKYT